MTRQEEDQKRRQHRYLDELEEDENTEGEDSLEEILYSAYVQQQIMFSLRSSTNDD